jgi:hypothetical protein
MGIRACLTEGSLAQTLIRLCLTAMVTASSVECTPSGAVTSLRAT